MASFAEFFNKISVTQLSVRVTDILEMIIIAWVIYHLLVWVKNTRTWFLLKGIAVLLSFVGIASILKFNTILFIVEKSLSVIVLAVVVVFQPELRKALEQLGKGNVILNFFSNSSAVNPNRFSAQTIDELVRASYALGRTRTGALMVIERELPLVDYIKTGIEVDAVVTSQLLINIFEHNTPLHDGAIVIRGNRVQAATCYLPLSANGNVSKDLGTRHRAALGVSDVTDSVTIIVSEETGRVSVASGGNLTLGVNADQLREILQELCAEEVIPKRSLLPWKGWRKNERKADE